MSGNTFSGGHNRQSAEKRRLTGSRRPGRVVPMTPDVVARHGDLVHMHRFHKGVYRHLCKRIRECARGIAAGQPATDYSKLLREARQQADLLIRIAMALTHLEGDMQPAAEANPFDKFMTN
jgi:hypothetical protein